MSTTHKYVAIMYKTVPRDTRISAAAIFYNGKVRSVWFALGGKKHEPKELCYTWESSEGVAPILHYSVRDGGSAYLLNYDTHKPSWSLVNAATKIS